MSFVSSSAIVESWGLPASVRTTDGMNEPIGSRVCIFAAAFLPLFVVLLFGWPRLSRPKSRFPV
jgi:hypothetical protein